MATACVLLLFPLTQGYGQSLELSAAVSNPCNSSLIKRFNQHSTMVLKACDKVLPRPAVDMALDNSTVSKDAATLPGSGVNGVNGAGDSESKGEPPPSKKVKSLGCDRLMIQAQGLCNCFYVLTLSVYFKFSLFLLG